MKEKLTFNGVAESVDAECDRDEKGKDFLGGAGGPSHETRDVKERVEDQEKG